MRNLAKGKRKDNKQWVKGYFTKISENFLIVNDQGSFPIEKDTLSFSTPFVDKNNVPIWENDIVEFQFDPDDDPFPNPNTKKRLGLIYYNPYRGSISIAYGNTQQINNDLWKYIRLSNRVRVLGNIFDTPDILKKGEGK